MRVVRVKVNAWKREKMAYGSSATVRGGSADLMRLHSTATYASQAAKTTRRTPGGSIGCSMARLRSPNETA